jgi:sterol desaturase/sphingolipid hydroxylase (fatty acid hydroxylase superfamily)
MHLAIGLLVWLLLMLSVERLWPRRDLADTTYVRIGVNLFLGGMNWGLARLVVPGGLVLVAFYAEARLWGVWHLLGLNGIFEFVTSIVFLDFSIWLQHWASHRVGWLWRIHRVHHLDVCVDVSTAVRFHPAEIIVSLVYKTLLIVSLGISPFAVASFELLLAASAMFNHANMRLPGLLDRALRFLIVTPDMHRIHHSIDRLEHDSNYGFFFSFWDKLFGVYTEHPKTPHIKMLLGLHESREATRVRNLGRLLVAPFVTKI